MPCDQTPVPHSGPRHPCPGTPPSHDLRLKEEDKLEEDLAVSHFSPVTPIKVKGGSPEAHDDSTTVELTALIPEQAAAHESTLACNTTDDIMQATVVRNNPREAVDEIEPARCETASRREAANSAPAEAIIDRFPSPSTQPGLAKWTAGKRKQTTLYSFSEKRRKSTKRTTPSAPAAKPSDGSQAPLTPPFPDAESPAAPMSQVETPVSAPPPRRDAAAAASPPQATQDDEGYLDMTLTDDVLLTQGQLATQQKTHLQWSQDEEVRLRDEGRWPLYTMAEAQSELARGNERRRARAMARRRTNGLPDPDVCPACNVRNRGVLKLHSSEVWVVGYVCTTCGLSVDCAACGSDAPAMVRRKTAVKRGKYCRACKFSEDTTHRQSILNCAGCDEFNACRLCRKAFGTMGHNHWAGGLPPGGPSQGR